MEIFYPYNQQIAADLLLNKIRRQDRRPENSGELKNTITAEDLLFYFGFLKNRSGLQRTINRIPVRRPSQGGKDHGNKI